jgi:hypothetical protein
LIYLEVFKIVSVNEMNRFIQQSKSIGEIALLKSFRAWIRETIASLFLIFNFVGVARWKRNFELERSDRGQ